jgi:peptidoglycan-N-acetylglucosamine deacetylase
MSMRFAMAGGVSLAVILALGAVAKAAPPEGATMPPEQRPAAQLNSASPLPASHPKCDNPNALGVSRTVEIDTTGGPGFGFEHFKMHDFLQPKEVVLTFDDGPWPVNTKAVLAALAAECVKATFFSIGKHATWHPEILKQVAAQGHTIGAHTWSHKDLSKLPFDQAKDDVEKGFSAVHWAVDGPIAPFVRFPALRHPPELVAYMGERNIAIFSTDVDSLDFKIHEPEKMIKSVMGQLGKRGKGIILMHDFQRVTGLALPELLKQLKENGYKVVHMKPKVPVTTLESSDAEVIQEIGGAGMAGANARPTKDIVHTISGNGTPAQ